jgi:hypothetical protein
MTYNGISLLQAGVALDKEVFAIMVNSDLDMYLDTFGRFQDRQLSFSEIETEYNNLLKSKDISELTEDYTEMIKSLSKRKKVKSKQNIEFTYKDKDDSSIIDDENDQVLMDSILNNENQFNKTATDNLKEETPEAPILDNLDEIEDTDSSNEEQELLDVTTATMQTEEINFELDDEELIIHQNKANLKETVSATELEKAAWTKMSDNMYTNELLIPFSNTGLLQLSNRYVYKFIANSFK